jgi:uncharacterized damage-inducible protein DinB
VNWTELLKFEIEAVYGTTARLLDKVDANSLGWKPATGSNWMTVGQLIKHITNACGAGCKGFVSGDWGLPAGKKPEDMSPEENLPPAEQLPTVESVDEAKRLLAEDKAVALQMIDRAGEDDLTSKEIAAPWAPDVSMSLGRHLLQMIQHLDRHKSQLFYYLKLQYCGPVGQSSLTQQRLPGAPGGSSTTRRLGTWLVVGDRAQPPGRLVAYVFRRAPSFPQPVAAFPSAFRPDA